MTGWGEPAALDRVPQGRSQEDLERRWADAAVFEVDAEGNFAAEGGRPDPLADPGERRDCDILLGIQAGRAWFARPVQTLTHGRGVPWRDNPAADALTASAVGLSRWHASAPLCELCGQATVPEDGGARRACVACGSLAFPRLDPAIIIAVLDRSDRLLLARSPAWPTGRRSVLAGFVEMGESAEQACFREVAEEVGVHLDDVGYVSSQPWPVPRSLMLGFVGVASAAHVVPDEHEIAEAGWWERDTLRRAVAAGEVILPGPASIARALIEAWLAGTLHAPNTTGPRHAGA